VTPVTRVPKERSAGTRAFASGNRLFSLSVASFPSPDGRAEHTLRTMKPERRSFEEWLAHLPFLVRSVLLSIMMLSGAGLVIAVRLAVGQISTDTSSLVPILFFVVAVAFLGAWRLGGKS
jgi:hypothetical protein